jgi:hypothetical protein
MKPAEPTQPLLRLRIDGLLDAASPLLLPIMAPRLQGDFHPAGTLKLALWGSGELATIRFAPLDGPFIYGPNRIVSLLHERAACWCGKGMIVMVCRI